MGRRSRQRRDKEDSACLPVAVGLQRRASWYVGAIAIIVVAVSAYYSSFRGVFLFDDIPHIVDNARIRSLTPITAWLHTRRPVVNLSFALNHRLGGSDPWGYHLVNLTVHILAGLVLFDIVRRTINSFGDSRSAWSRPATGLAAVTALLWVVHPLQTQSVTYIVQRGESMMGLFYLLTLYCVIRGSQSTNTTHHRADAAPRWSVPRFWYVAAIMCCGLGMGSKAVMVTAPAVVFLYDWVFLGRDVVRMLRLRWWLYGGLSATWLVLWLVGIGGVLKTEATGQATVGFAVKGITPWQYAISQPSVVLHYLRLCVWPRGQCLDYDWPRLASAGQAALPAMGILAMLGGTVWGLRRKAWPGFLGAWFFLILLPTSSFIPIRDLAFEHRMYLPLAAVVLLGVVCGHAAIARLCKARPILARMKPWVSFVVVVVLVSVLGFATARRNSLYHSREAMWRDVLDGAGHNARAHLGLGLVIYEDGNTLGALEHYRQAVQLKPRYAQARTNLGLVLGELGHPTEAIAQLRTAIEIKPTLMKAYRILAGIFVKQGQLDRAVRLYRQALQIDPTWSLGHTRLGVILAMQARRSDAMAEFSEAIRLDPTSAEPHYCLGVALQQSGQFAKAIEEFESTLQIEPAHADAKSRLETLILQQARTRGP